MRRLVLIAAWLVAATPVLAERPPYRFEINFGAYIPRLDTRIRLDGPGGLLGAELDFEESFNLANSTIVPVAQVDIWPSKKHGLSLIAFDLSRSSTGQSSIDFRFGDRIFAANVPLDVAFDTKVAALTYSYKFFNNEHRSFGFNAGFNINQIDARIAISDGPDSGTMESGEATAPLPVFGVNGHVMLSKKWKFYGTIGVFALSFDQYSGVLTSVSGGFIHHTFKNVGFGAGVYGFTVRVDSDNEGLMGRVEYGYNGVIAYLNLRFR